MKKKVENFISLSVCILIVAISAAHALPNNHKRPSVEEAKKLNIKSEKRYAYLKENTRFELSDSLLADDWVAQAILYPTEFDRVGLLFLFF